MSSSATDAASGEVSAAQKLMQQHAEDSHHATVEDVPDEDLPPKHNDAADEPAWNPNVSVKAAGKQKENIPSGKIDTQSHDSFPELGAPKTKTANVAPIWGAKNNTDGKSNSSTPANGVSRSSTPGSSGGNPKSTAPLMSIPGRNVESIVLEPQYILPRTQLRRPIPDIIKDINRKSRANIAMSNSSNGRLKFDATGSQDVAQQALRDLVNQIGTKTTITVTIPRSARAYVIGKQGSVIKQLQDKTGARIQLPKVDANANTGAQDEDDDATIDILVEGNAVSAAAARNEILKIAGERAATVNAKLRDVPAHFYPFLAGPDNITIEELEKSGVNIRVPSYKTWASEPLPAIPEPGQRPAFTPAADNHIHLAGDRAAVQAARADLERRVAELHEQLLMEQFAIQQGRHQFIVGPRGVTPEEFFAQTGCAIFLPTEDDNEQITVIGPQDRINEGMEHAMDLAMNMQSSNIDISRFHKNVPGGAPAIHARNVTRFLRHRDIIADLEKAHNTHINTPATSQGHALPWELYARDGKNAIKAQSAITGVIHALPPSRIATVPVDSFYHAYLHKHVGPQLTQSNGVHVVLPGREDPGAPVLLVYEGPSATQERPEIKPGAPSQDEIKAFQNGLDVARNNILDIINKQEKIDAVSIDVPQKFHERLRRFIKEEQKKRANDQIPVRVSSAGTTVTVRGPASTVRSWEAKINAFVEQETEDDKERDFTMSFEFPQKYANHLIGKGGSKINELRDTFDVDIQVGDNQVELKGPKKKSEAAKSHILAMARSLADETTHIIKVDPKYHRELIGSGGSLINRLQNKYKVVIFFPKVGKAAKDDASSAADADSDAGKPKRQQQPDEVIIRGGKKGADEAREEIQSLLLWLIENSHGATVTVQQKQVPSIIGQGGAALDDLRQATGARIDIPSGRDAETVEIQVKGTKAQVAAAKKALEEQRSVFDDTVVKTLDVDKKYHKALIGTGGATLREVIVGAGGSDDRRELARTVQFPRQEADGNTIKIEGRSSVVDKIVARLEEIVAERENQVTESVDVPVEKHRTLIGRGGDTKRQLESQLSVSIEVPRRDDGKTDVKITGLPENVSKAKEHIAGLVKEQDGVTMQIPRSLHHAVSNNGSLFRQVRNNHQVIIGHDGHSIPGKPSVTRADGGSLPLITDDEDAAADAHSWKTESLASTDDGDIPWVLRGPTDNVEKVTAMINNALEQARRNTTVGYLILPDPKTYRYVIGQGGNKVNSIRKQSGCRISVPRNDSNEDAIEVTGSEEGVEKAKDLILEAVREGLASRRE